MTNRHLCTGNLPEQLKKIAGENGPRMVILREKDLPEREYERLARQVLEVCREKKMDCVLHSYPDAARRLNCPAIHMPLRLYRSQWKQLQDFSVRGTSVHSVEEAIWAQEHGATYVTAGHIYLTDCKKGLPARGLDFLKEVCEAVSVPVYAIGGISEERLEEVKGAGAAGACMMSGYMK
ncbi:MAG: thiamine phosphate synthase [Ruminococcus sp.]